MTMHVFARRSLEQCDEAAERPAALERRDRPTFPLTGDVITLSG